jgi:hypothetical protein
MSPKETSVQQNVQFGTPAVSTSRLPSPHLPPSTSLCVLPRQFPLRALRLGAPIPPVTQTLLDKRFLPALAEGCLGPASSLQLVRTRRADGPVGETTTARLNNLDIAACQAGDV